VTRSAAARIDHLVVQASTLAEGVAWCEATLGVPPSAGGEHAFMGTHNRLVNLSSTAFPQCYLEIIAINSIANNAERTCRNRWFDMDDSVLQAHLAQHGPRLTHWVCRVPDAQASTQALAAQGIDRGVVTTASRMTPHGVLSWQITLREDGQRLFDGCLPTLIQWGTQHPVQRLPDLGVQLLSLHLDHPDAATLAPALQAIGLDPAASPHTTHAAQPALRARLMTPRGVVDLPS